MIIRKFIASLLLILFTHPIFAQKKIILEKIRCQSFNMPLKNYLENEDINKTVAAQLSHTLLQHQMLLLADTAKLNIEFLPFSDAISAVKPDFSDNDTSNLHLYIDFFEASPAVFFFILIIISPIPIC